jgi:hypothetical protein
MRTSLNNIRTIEHFLSGMMSPQNQLVFRAGMILDPALKIHTAFQKQLISIVRSYSRKQLRAEITEVHQKVWKSMPQDEQRQMLNLFSKE